MNETTDLGKEYTDILARFAGQSIDNSPAPTAPVETPEVPQEVPAQTEPTAPVAETPIVPEVVQPVTEVKDENEVWSDWDATPEVAAPVTPEVTSTQSNEIFS